MRPKDAVASLPVVEVSKYDRPRLSRPDGVQRASDRRLQQSRRRRRCRLSCREGKLHASASSRDGLAGGSSMSNTVHTRPGVVWEVTAKAAAMRHDPCSPISASRQGPVTRRFRPKDVLLISIVIYLSSRTGHLQTCSTLAPQTASLISGKSDKSHGASASPVRRPEVLDRPWDLGTAVRDLEFSRLSGDCGLASLQKTAASRTGARNTTAGPRAPGSVTAHRQIASDA